MFISREPLIKLDSEMGTRHIETKKRSLLE